MKGRAERAVRMERGSQRTRALWQRAISVSRYAARGEGAGGAGGGEGEGALEAAVAVAAATVRGEAC